ncbi:MAG: alpha-glucosidase C-terminal domain-containing protein [Deltaproteobacteria bacterium]|nr:alpha-glucosidase C-terminal domain-containing protein [Nannocystaceae bacterium]
MVTRYRRCLPALRRGGFRVLGATADQLAFVREHEDAPALVVLSRADTAASLTIPAAVAPGWYKDAMSEQRALIGQGGATLELPAFGVMVLIPEGHDCADLDPP